MPAPSHPAHTQRTVQVTGSTEITGPPLAPWQMAVAAVALVLLLWVAYRIGKVILRVVAGLLFIGLLAFGIWYLFIK
jgi:hypothetical protein